MTLGGLCHQQGRITCDGPWPSVAAAWLLWLGGCGPAALVAEAVPLTEQIRTLPLEPEVPYIRNVLICGPFYGPPEDDFLPETGGESAARPTAAGG